MAKFNMNDLINAQSRSAAAEAKPEGFKIVNVDIEKIVPSSANMYGIREIEELAASIESVGLLHNLVTRELGDGRHEIISGERRYRACKMLYDSGNTQYASLPCKVEGASSDAVAELKLIFANATARELTDYEKAEQAKRMKELFRQLRAEGYEIKGRLREIVADVLDVSPAQVGRLESVAEKLIPEFKEELKAGNIGISAAYDASTLPQEQQRETLDAYKAEGAEAVKKAKRKTYKQRMVESKENADCEYGGKCQNAEGIASHVDKEGNLNCAGCCKGCTEAKDGTCETVCDPVKRNNSDIAVANAFHVPLSALRETEEAEQTPETVSPQGKAAEDVQIATDETEHQKPGAQEIGRVLEQQRSEETRALAKQLRAVAGNIPFDAVCDMDGEEINIRAVCTKAAKRLEEI